MYFITYIFYQFCFETSVHICIFIFSMNVTTTETWGYPINGSDCFTGIVGTVQENCGDCEISATGIMWKNERSEKIDFATDIDTFM